MLLTPKCDITYLQHNSRRRLSSKSIVFLYIYKQRLNKTKQHLIVKERKNQQSINKVYTQHSLVPAPF